MIRSSSAWLVTWAWTSDSAAVADRIAAVFPRQWGSARVQSWVEWLYAIHTSTVAELVAYAGRPGRNPYKVRSERGWIVCGSHPWLEARIVTDLVVDEDTEGFETVSWKEPDRYRIVEEGGMIKEAEGGRTRTTRRLRGPLSSDPIWDRSAGRFKSGWVPDELPPQRW